MHGLLPITLMMLIVTGKISTGEADFLAATLGNYQVPATWRGILQQIQDVLGRSIDIPVGDD